MVKNLNLQWKNMNAPKIIRQFGPLAGNLFFVFLFCSLLGLTNLVIEHLDASLTPKSVLARLRIFNPNDHSKNLKCSPPQALFDGPTIKKTLLGLLDKTQPGDEVLITTFVITDNEICQAIKNKQNTGVNIKIISDAVHSEKQWSKIPALVQAGVPVFKHDPASENIMHNKFMIFDFKDDKSVVVTGSYNLTHNAATKNAENMVIIDHPTTVAEYRKHFYELLKKSIAAHCLDRKKQ